MHLKVDGNSNPERKNKIYWDDAMSFDYKKALIENELNNDVDFYPVILTLKKVL